MVFAWIFIAIIVFVLGLAYYGSSFIMEIPYLAVPYTPKDYGWPYEEIAFQSFDGLKLTGWFIPAPNPSTITIIVQHGVGSNHGDMLPNARCLYEPGLWNLFYYNFRGHADSEGDRTSLGPLELKDLEKALEFLKTHKPKESQRLAIFGHSLGAAVAIVGAAQHTELEAVAAESPFASISKTVRRFGWIYHRIPYFPFVPLAIYFASFKLGVRLGDFNPVESIGKISPRPVFLIHGGRDIRMPMSDFETLWAAAHPPKEQLVVPEADHGDPWLIDRKAYETGLIEFFRKALK